MNRLDVELSNCIHFQSSLIALCQALREPEPETVTSEELVNVRQRQDDIADSV
jgi:hypothetical protein